jgi:hypothetical protein
MDPLERDPYAGFAPGFFDRADDAPDPVFYGPPRLVTHIDDGAIAAVGALYAELGIDGSAPEPRRVAGPHVLVGVALPHTAVRAGRASA